MKRALITGVMGFTGYYVAAELASHDWEVWGLGFHPAPESPRYRCVDLADAQGLVRVVEEIRPNAVVHLAAISFVAHKDSNAIYAVNLIGSRNLLAALAACSKKPDCVLLASSANIYGNSAQGVLAEHTLPQPANDYAVSKLAMEYMARLWMDTLPVVIARPFNYTGLGQTESFLIPKIVGHFRRKASSIELGNLDVWRDFSDVRAVAQIYRRLLERAPAGETVNICSGTMHSLREVIALMEKISSRAISVAINPAFVRANEVRELCGDPSKLHRLIGDWSNPSFEETLRWMLAGETD